MGKTLTEAEQLELIPKAKAGDRDAMNCLCVVHTGLLRQIAFEFAKQSPGHEVDDLSQEGAFALIDAVRWFDMSRGFEFSTFAAKAIRRRIARHLETVNAKRIPQEPLEKGGDNPLEMFGTESLLGDERIEEIRQAVQALPHRDRRVVEAVYGLSHEPCDSLPDALGCSEIQIQETLDRALAQL